MKTRLLACGAVAFAAAFMMTPAPADVIVIQLVPEGMTDVQFDVTNTADAQSTITTSTGVNETGSTLSNGQIDRDEAMPSEIVTSAIYFDHADTMTTADDYGNETIYTATDNDVGPDISYAMYVPRDYEELLRHTSNRPAAAPYDVGKIGEERIGLNILVPAAHSSGDAWQQFLLT